MSLISLEAARISPSKIRLAKLMAVHRYITKLERRGKNKFGEVVITRDYPRNFSVLLVNEQTAGSIDPARENVIQILIGSLGTS
jgi:hypothetical protein